MTATDASRTFALRLRMVRRRYQSKSCLSRNMGVVELVQSASGPVDLVNDERNEKRWLQMFRGLDLRVLVQTSRYGGKMGTDVGKIIGGIEVNRERKPSLTQRWVELCTWP